MIDEWYHWGKNTWVLLRRNQQSFNKIKQSYDWISEESTIFKLFIIFEAFFLEMNLRGQIIRVKQREYVLKDKLGEGGFSMIYETNQPDIICKVQVLLNP